MIIEAFVPGLFIFICFAAAALVTGLIDQMTDFSLEFLLGIDLLLSVIFLLLLKPFLQRIIKMPAQSGSYNSYPFRLEGQEGMIFKSIVGGQTGAVKLLDVDETWLAKSENHSDIGHGTSIVVLRVEGNHLIVAEKP